MEITKEHIEILKHTATRAACGLFCGDSKEMQELCDLKMMEYVGRKSYVPDPYFTLTPDGRAFLEDLENNQQER